MYYCCFTKAGLFFFLEIWMLVFLGTLELHFLKNKRKIFELCTIDPIVFSCIYFLYSQKNALVSRVLTQTIFILMKSLQKK